MPRTFPDDDGSVGNDVTVSFSPLVSFSDEK